MYNDQVLKKFKKFKRIWESDPKYLPEDECYDTRPVSDELCLNLYDKYPSDLSCIGCDVFKYVQQIEDRSLIYQVEAEYPGSRLNCRNVEKVADVLQDHNLMLRFLDLMINKIEGKIGQIDVQKWSC